MYYVEFENHIKICHLYFLAKGKEKCQKEAKLHLWILAMIL